MAQEMNIQRNARVVAPDGEVGRVRHVVVDPQTREVTDLVVGHDGREWMVPISAVASVEGDRVRLRSPWSEFEAAGVFDRNAFVGVDDEEAERESQQRAVRGGAPLRAANDDAVDVGVAGQAPVAPERPVGGQERVISRETPYRLQLKAEQLHVTKRPEQVGAVRISKRVVEHTETITVPVREERLLIECLPGSGKVMIGDRELREGESMELTLIRERVTVGKDVVVSEDVAVRKETVEFDEQVQETVRKEELVVDRTGELAVENP